MEEDGIIMPLYWACQEVQAKLAEDGADRQQIIVESIQDNLEKFASNASKVNFETDLTWFNSASPLTRESLQGFVTVIDFFTYCCINCMHILPDLERLEDKFSEGLAIIGVHSAKFENEKSEFQLENAIKRYGISHPVCNDTQLNMWNNLGVTCWPTLLILSPSGVPIHVFIGEGHSDFLFEYISTTIQYFKDNGDLTNTRLPRSLHSKISSSALKYPGKISLNNKNLVVSDSGNNRLLVVDLTTKNVLHTIGTGKRGSDDGDFDKASFSNPQGVTSISDDVLLVADTDNHLIRKVDVANRKVSTVGGTGKQGQDKEGGKTGIEQEISSPWDIIRLSESAAAIAMAGIHQIWLYCWDDVSWWKGVKYPAGTLVRIVGSGAEENRNNSYPAKAGLAQPSGLCLDVNFAPAGALYVADSESSTIRRIDLKDGAVKNVCGGERDPTNLFAYGDIDGAGVNAKLQHPLATAWNSVKSELYIADSYNHKLKKVTGPKNDVTSMDAKFCEPGGICVSEDGNTLYIADTNNHCIKAMDLNTSDVQVIDIEFGEAKCADDNTIVHIIDADLGSEREIILTGNLNHPDFKLNTEGKSSWKIEVNAEEVETSAAAGDINSDLSINFRLKKISQSISFSLRCKVYLCHKISAMCIAKSIKHNIQLNHVATTNHNNTLNIGSLLQF